MSTIRFANNKASTIPTSGYAPRIPEKEWAAREDFIRRLHGEGLTKKDIREQLAIHHGFYPSIAQLAERCRKWNLTVYNVHKPGAPMDVDQEETLSIERESTSQNVPLSTKTVVDQLFLYLLPFTRLLGVPVSPEVNLSDLLTLESKTNDLLSAGFYEAAFDLYGALLCFIIKSNLKTESVILGFRCILNCLRSFVDIDQLDWIFDNILEFMSTIYQLRYPPFLRTLLAIHMYSCCCMSEHARRCYSIFLTKHMPLVKPSEFSYGMRLYCNSVRIGAGELCILSSNLDLSQIWPFQVMIMADIEPAISHLPYQNHLKLTVEEIYPLWRWCISCIVDFAGTVYVSPFEPVQTGSHSIESCQCRHRLYQHLVMVATNEELQGLEIDISTPYGRQQINLFDSLSIMSRFLTSSFTRHDWKMSGPHNYFSFQALLHAKSVFEASQSSQEAWLRESFEKSLKPGFTYRAEQGLEWSDKYMWSLGLSSISGDDASPPDQSMPLAKQEFDRILMLRRSPTRQRFYHTNDGTVAQIYHALDIFKRSDILPTTPPVSIGSTDMQRAEASWKEQDSGNKPSIVTTQAISESGDVMNTREDFTASDFLGSTRKFVPYELIASPARPTPFDRNISTFGRSGIPSFIALPSNPIPVPSSQKSLPTTPTLVPANGLMPSSPLPTLERDSLLSPAKPWSDTSSLRSFMSTAQRHLTRKSASNRERQSGSDVMSLMSGVSTRSSWSLRKYFNVSSRSSSMMQVD